MNDATLNGFRMIADTMLGDKRDWCWVGQWMSQRMFGISEARAKEYAAKHGGVAMMCEEYLAKQEAENRTTRERIARLEAEYQATKK